MVDSRTIPLVRRRARRRHGGKRFLVLLAGLAAIQGSASALAAPEPRQRDSNGDPLEPRLERPAFLVSVQGFGEEVAAIQQRWRSGDRAGAAAQVSDEMLGELVLAGTPDRIKQGLEAYGRSGLGTAALAIASIGSREGLERVLAELSS